jgi:hypothetical protein
VRRVNHVTNSSDYDSQKAGADIIYFLQVNSCVKCTATERTFLTWFAPELRPGAKLIFAGTAKVKRVDEAEQRCVMLHQRWGFLGIHKRSQIRHYGVSLSYNAKGKANELKTEFTNQGNGTNEAWKGSFVTLPTTTTSTSSSTCSFALNVS